MAKMNALELQSKLNLFSPEIQSKISSFLSYPSFLSWKHTCPAIYDATLHPGCLHLILFFSATHITLFDTTRLQKVNKHIGDATSDISDKSAFDSLIFEHCYINPSCIIDEVILSPLSQSRSFSDRLKWCSLIGSLYQCKNAKSLTLWFDHCSPTTYDLIPIWKKYLTIISNDILVSSKSLKTTHCKYSLHSLQTLSLKFSHSWISNDITSIIDCLIQHKLHNKHNIVSENKRNNKKFKWTSIKKLEISSMSFHEHSLLKCSHDTLLKFWCTFANIECIDCYIECKGNEWEDVLVSKVLQCAKELPNTLTNLNMFTTFARVPSLKCVGNQVKISLFPLKSVYHKLNLDNAFESAHVIWNELKPQQTPPSNKHHALEVEAMIHSYLSCPDHISSLTLMKLIAYQNGRNRLFVECVLGYIVKFCQSIFIGKNAKNDGNIDTYFVGKSILKLNCLLIYFLRSFWNEIVRNKHEWIHNIANQLYEISLKLRDIDSNICSLLRKCSLSLDKMVIYCTKFAIFNEKHNNKAHFHKLIPIQLPLLDVICIPSSISLTAVLYSNSLTYLYSRLFAHILFSPSMHSSPTKMLSLFRAINYQNLQSFHDRHLVYNILLWCLNCNRNLWGSSQIVKCLQSSKPNNHNSMGYPVFIHRNEFDDELDAIRDKIKQECTRILKFNVFIPLANKKAYLTNLLSVENNKQLMEFHLIFKAKLVTTQYQINQDCCRFFSFKSI